MILEIVVLIGLIALLAMQRQHRDRIRALEFDLDALRRTYLEDRAGRERAPAATPDPVTETAEPVEPAMAAEDADGAERGPWSVQDDMPSPPAAEEPPTRPDIETALGTRWAVWVGGLALALGGLFLVRYSIEAGIFGPGARLTAAALLGIGLAFGGEVARRIGFRAPVGGIEPAYIPAILTAAGSFTLFGAIYAAHGVYGFIDATTAFLLLGGVALATLAAALVHGQAVAGLGLLGALATPMLVASDAPNAWVLFGYLAVVLAGAIAIASVRRWRFLASAAFGGVGLWSVAFIAFTYPPDPEPLAFIALAMIGLLAGLWLREDGVEVRTRDPASAIVALFTALPALAMAATSEFAAAGGGIAAGLVLAALVAAAIWRPRGAALLHAAGLAALAALYAILFGDRLILDLDAGIALEGAWQPSAAIAFVPVGWALAALLFLAGLAMARREAATRPRRAAAFAFWAAAAPIAALAMAWLSFGDLDIDWRYAAAFLALAAGLAAAGELTAGAEAPPLTGRLAASLLLAGSSLALLAAIVSATGPALSAVLGGLAAALPAYATRARSYPVLGWLSAGFAAAALIRVGLDPTIVGPAALGEKPVFNALLPTYALPAAAFAWSAWQLARTTGGRPRLLMEAFAVLFALLTAGMLTRHAVAGGLIDAGPPNLAEQAIYTLIAIGGGWILLALDARSPSPVFRWGAMAAGLASVAFVAVQHFIVLNPYFTNESTGRIAVFNLLVLAYLLPAAGLAALAWQARGKRPDWYVRMLALVAAALGFAWATLSVRRFYQGEFIGAWKGMDGLETYTYSAVWLAIGVSLLVAGLRLRSRMLRLASAVLVVVAVAKVFLFDMSELEGVLRAFSFIGLGAVLIGIGMFYQRMLVKAAR